MKWEVKRYTSLMQTFNREADLKALELANLNGNDNGHHQSEPDEQKRIVSGSRDRTTKASRDPSHKATSSNGRLNQKSKRSPNVRASTRDANG